MSARPRRDAPRGPASRGGAARAAAWALGAVLGAACAPTEGARPASQTLVVGIDVSGSFRQSGYYEDAIEFAARYLYAHANGIGGLAQPTALFVGSVGGARPGEPKAFHPIHDLQGKSVEQIAADLRAWFPPDDALTDFNAFFRRVASLVKERGLLLAPIEIVLFSDGVHDVTGRARAGDPSLYRKIDLAPIEFLARRVTVRLLYASPTVADGWRREIPRRRVRVWAVEPQVMVGWRAQWRPGLPPEAQDDLWRWVRDNVDFRVRARRIL